MKTTPEQRAELKRIAELAQPLPFDANGEAPNYAIREFSAYIGPELVTDLLADLEELQARLSSYERTDDQPSELELHRADYQACKGAGFESPGELLDAYEKLQSRLAAAEKDAERWCEVKANPDFEIAEWSVSGEWVGTSPNEDEAIDAAIAAGKESHD